MLATAAMWLAMMANDGCPMGTVMSGGIETSDFVYPAECRTPEDKEEAEEMFAESMCGNGGMSLNSNGWSHHHSQQWIYHECIVEDHYYHDGVEVTQQEFRDALGVDVPQ